VALALATIATLLVSLAIGLIALVLSAVSFGVALARGSDQPQGRASASVPQRRGEGRPTPPRDPDGARSNG
jgi:hypothetical protein